MDGAYNSSAIRKFAESLIADRIRSMQNATKNCSRVSITGVSFNPSPSQYYTSSNGIGTFSLSGSINETLFDSTGSSPPVFLKIRVNRSQADPFSTGLFNKCNQTLYNLNQSYPYNVWYYTDNSSLLYREAGIGQITGALPFSIRQRELNIEVLAY